MATVDARKIRQRLAKRIDKAVGTNQEFVWLTIDEAKALLTLDKASEPRSKNPTAPEHTEPVAPAATDAPAAPAAPVEPGACAGCRHPLVEHGALGCRQCKCDLQPFANHAA